MKRHGNDMGMQEQPPSGEWTTRCGLCGHVAVVKTDDVSGFLETGFPVCCGETMLLTIEPVSKTKEPPFCNGIPLSAT
jgi:hypothetical protein